jgi:hypothetical protein
MADIASLLDQTLRAAGVPIIGVSIGVIADRATWQVQYDPSASGAQQAQGESIRATFDVNAPAVVNAELDRQSIQAAAQTVQKANCALMLDVKLNRRLTAADAPTVLAMFDQWKVYYKFIVNNGL